MPASPHDLASAAALKRWLGSTTTTDDELLGDLITGASRAILAQLGRGATLIPAAVTEVQDGRDTTGITLARWPVLSVTSLTVEGAAIAATSWPASGTPSLAGYLLSAWDGFPPGAPQSLQLVGGGRFPKNPQNTTVVYTAGYQVTAEAATVAGAGYKVQVAAPHGPWASNVAVTKADGTAMTKVASAPAAGQYALDNANPGTYQFAAADNGLGVLITYGFVPADLSRACVEAAAERYRYKERIGQTSRSLGGQETAAYDTDALSKHILLLIQPYKRVFV